jgi:hypothetical protein
MVVALGPGVKSCHRAMARPRVRRPYLPRVRFEAAQPPIGSSAALRAHSRHRRQRQAPRTALSLLDWCLPDGAPYSKALDMKVSSARHGLLYLQPIKQDGALTSRTRFWVDVANHNNHKRSTAFCSWNVQSCTPPLCRLLRLPSGPTEAHPDQYLPRRYAPRTRRGGPPQCYPRRPRPHWLPHFITIRMPP